MGLLFLYAFFYVGTELTFLKVNSVPAFDNHLLLYYNFTVRNRTTERQ